MVLLRFQSSVPSSVAGIRADIGQSSSTTRAPVTPAVWVALWAAMTASYVIGFVDAAGMVDPATLPYLMSFYNQVASKSVTEAAVQQQQLLQCRYPNPCWCDISSTARGWFITLRMVATAVAALPAAWLSRLAGRRAATCTGAAFVLVGQVLQASAQHWLQLLLGNLLIGLGIAPMLHSSWVECAEIAPAQWRAGFLACSAVGRSCGLWASLVCMAAVDMSQLAHGWRLVVVLGAWPTLVKLILVIWLPETPNSLIQRGRLAEGRETLRMIRGPFYDCNKELVDIWQSAGRPTQVMHSKVRIMLDNIRELLQPGSLPPLFVNVVLALFMQSTTNYLMMGYILSPLLHVIFPTNAHINGPAVVGAAAAFGCLVAAAAASYFSPRAIITCGCTAAAITWLAMGLAIRPLTAGSGAPAAGVAGMFAVFAINVAANGGLASMFPVVTTENQPLSTRAHAVAIAIGLDYLMHGIGTAFKGALLCSLTTKSFFMAAGSNLFVAVFTLLLLPDTKHLPLEVINQRWAVHWLWQRVYTKHQSGRGNTNRNECSDGTSAAAATSGSPLPQSGSLQLLETAAAKDADGGPTGASSGAVCGTVAPGDGADGQQKQQQQQCCPPR